MPRFLFQKQIWQEVGYAEIAPVLRDLGIHYAEASIIPFTDHLDPEPEEAPDHVFGSGRLVDIARSRGWRTFASFAPVEDCYPPEAWLNGDGRRVLAGDLAAALADRPEAFVKPFREKLFTGGVLRREDLRAKGLDGCFQIGSTGDLGTEPLWVAAPKRVASEQRFFVVDGTVVTGSRYRFGGQVAYGDPDPAARDWLRQLIAACGAPDICFTADVAVTLDGSHRLVELNNANSAGFYACDKRALFGALLAIG